MNKVKRKELVEKANEHELRLFQIEKALEQHGINWFAEEPKLKQLDQSVFDGLDAQWRFAAVDDDGRAYAFMRKPEIDEDDPCFIDGDATKCKWIGEDYDTTNWQNSLIERDIAKELLEVDLSSELTGSELCRAMLERGDKFVMCHVGINKNITVITGWNGNGFTSVTNQNSLYLNPTPINNQGEPLTASEVGL